jgi:hypothetical protein
VPVRRWVGRDVLVLANSRTENDRRRDGRGAEFDALLSGELQRRRALYKMVEVRVPRVKLRTGVVLLIMLLGGFLVVFSGAHLVPTLLGWTDCGAPVANRHAVALIDSMANQYPDPAFVNSVREAAQNAGYGFDYYPPASATVDLFSKLPDLGYSIIILRMHGTGVVRTDPSWIVTADLYSGSQYLGDQLLGRVGDASVNGTQYLAVTPSFISDSMCGRFSGTLILAMFCESGQYSSLAEAFLGRGAGYYVGWNATVTVSHTDQAFSSLTDLLLSGMPLSQSIEKVMTTVGPDPTYGAGLISYSQGSFSLAGVPFWEAYWYIISAGVLVAVVGLARVRKSQAKRAD